MEDPKQIADYSYWELLAKIPKNPIVQRSIPAPILAKTSKKLCITNFRDLCLSIFRLEHSLGAYISTELGTSYSINNENQLIITGKYNQIQIEIIIKNYIRKYVICKTCQSHDTILEKKNRLTLVKCLSCQSILSV